MLNLLSLSLKNGIGGGFSPFDPLTLNPILAFKSSEEVYAVGDLDTPVLDWDADHGGSRYGPTPTVVRAGSATYVDVEGNVVEADPDTIRVDYSLGEPGFLVEPAATQLVGYTDFSSGWTEAGTTVSSGGGYAGQESVVVVSDISGGAFRTDIPTTALTDYAGGFFARRVSGTGTVRIRHENSATGNSTIIDVSSEWEFFEAGFLGEASSGSVRFGVYLNTLGGSVEIAMPQVEVGTVATSHILNTTGSPITRNADLVSIGGTDFSSLWGAENTVYAEVISRELGVPTISIDDGTEDNSYLTTLDAETTFVILNDMAVEADLATGSDAINTVSKFAFSAKTDSITASSNGEDEVPDDNASLPVVSTFRMGSNFDGSTIFNGHIKRIVWWDSYLGTLAYIFNPLEFGPFLLIDSAEEVYNEFSEPAFDWVASEGAGAAYGPNPVVARTGGMATYVDEDGIVQTAADDEIRIDYTNGRPGFLIEPAAENLVPTHVWTAGGSAVSTAGATGPDGSTDAYTISNLLGTTPQEAAYSTPAAVAGSTQYAASSWVKGPVGETVSFYAKRVDGSSSSSALKQVVLDGTWQRVSDITWSTAADNTQARVILYHETGDTADTVDVWNGQLELGSKSTSTIEPGETRNADVVTVSGTDFSEMWNPLAGTIYTEAVGRDITNITAIYSATDGTTGNLIRSYFRENTHLSIRAGAVTQTTLNCGDCFVDQLARIAATWTTDDAAASLDGGPEETQGAPMAVPTVDRLNIGHLNGGSHLNGWVERITIWPKHSDDL